MAIFHRAACCFIGDDGSLPAVSFPLRKLYEIFPQGRKTTGVSGAIPHKASARDWWNPEAMCNGVSAGARAEMLLEQGFTVEAAKQEVRRQFPAAFGGVAEAEPARLKAAGKDRARLDKSLLEIVNQAKRMAELEAEVERLRLQEQQAAARAELEQLALSELRKSAKEAGMDDRSMYEVDDLDSKKAMQAAFIEFIELRRMQDTERERAAVKIQSLHRQRQAKKEAQQMRNDH